MALGPRRHLEQRVILIFKWLYVALEYASKQRVILIFNGSTF